KSENYLLLEKTKKLENQLSILNDEKIELERKLSSLNELRKALKELKLKARRQKEEETRRRNAEGLLLGNRGYLVRDGKPTFNPRYIIHVFPPEQVQE
ncbi:MAG: hypothetical protein AB7E08_06455, partial [Candidatus Omnitrophota bacterium]